MVSPAPIGVERVPTLDSARVSTRRHGVIAVIRLPEVVAACARPKPPAVAATAATPATPIHLLV